MVAWFLLELFTVVENSLGSDIERHSMLWCSLLLADFRLYDGLEGQALLPFHRMANLTPNRTIRKKHPRICVLLSPPTSNVRKKTLVGSPRAHTHTLTVCCPCFEHALICICFMWTSFKYVLESVVRTCSFFA